MSNKFLFALVMGLQATTLLQAQPVQQQMRDLMAAYHAYNMFDGAVLVADKGKIVYQGAFGMANREWNIPNSTDTKFMIGSVSKPLTAMLTLIQVQKGLLALDSTLSHYLPAFNNKPAAKVTVRQLLNHTSGIPNYDIIKDFFPRLSRQYFSRTDYLKTYIDSALAFPPGTRYLYSSWGYFTLGYLLETVTGKSYAALMQQDLFAKAGMTSSGSYAHTQIVPRRATGYDYSIDGYTSNDFRDQSNTMGTGDIYSTVGDLFRFHEAIMQHTLINDALTREMLAPGMDPANYGFGWFNKPFKYSPTDSAASNFHLGMTDGFISFVRRIPSTNTVVVMLCNSSPTDFFGITNNLLRLLRHVPVKLKAPVHKKMEQLIRQQGMAAALKAYPAMKADTAHYYIDWISMNFLAQQLQTARRLEEAKQLAENNLREFADKDLVQVTMGNIYVELGQKAAAIACYRAALQINPQYEEARNRLKELEQP